MDAPPEATETLPARASRRRAHRIAWAMSLPRPDRDAWIGFYARFHQTPEADALYADWARRNP